MRPRRRLSITLAMLCALAAVGSAQCHRPAPASVAPDAARLRVMTFNVNFGVAEHPDNVRAIRDANADVVLLQETTPAAESVIREELADTYPHMRFIHCCRAGGLAVLSRQPILEHERIAATIGWFPAARVVVASPWGPLQVLNVHLRPPVSDEGSWVSGYFSTRSLRGEEIEAFWRRIDEKLPTIVAGDFNESDRGRALAFLSDQGLTSALPERSPHATTWRWPTALGTLRAQLDHIVLDRSFAWLDVRVLERGRSDHLPVIVDLTTKDGGSDQASVPSPGPG